MTKRDILKELATSLYLLMALSKPVPAGDDIDAKSLDDTRQKADAALRMAEPVIGILNAKIVQEFMETRDEKFTIPCGVDMVKGDRVRFEEHVFDTVNRSSRYLGRRIIYAEVIEVRHEARDCLVTLRIISTQGTLPLFAGTEIRRLTHSARNARRVPWRDESKRPVPFTPPSIVYQKHQSLQKIGQAQEGGV